MICYGATAGNAGSNSRDPGPTRRTTMPGWNSGTGRMCARWSGNRRFDTTTELVVLRELYDSLRLYRNFFQPSMKLESKERAGGRIHSKYQIAKTPYQRLLDSGPLSRRPRSGCANHTSRSTWSNSVARWSSCAMSCSIWSQAKWRTAFARHDGGSPFGGTAASDAGGGFGGMLHRVNKESGAPTRPGIVAFEVRGLRSSETSPRNCPALENRKPLSPNGRTQGLPPLRSSEPAPSSPRPRTVRAGATLADADNLTTSQTDRAFRLISTL